MRSENFVREKPRLAIVLPCFNESEALDHTLNILLMLIKKLTESDKISDDSYLFVVDDGSSDSTWKIVEELHLRDDRMKGLKLSKNFGHQAALMAGLMEVSDKCDAVISIDADLQQDPNAIYDFLEKYMLGADVVLGIRRDRSSDGYLKKQSAIGFYKILKFLGVDVANNHADYRLLSKRALAALRDFDEPNIFLRATCLELGFNVASVFFDVTERKFGQSKYSLKKMLRLALHGITAHSVVPLRIVATIGFILFVFSLSMAAYIGWRAVVVGDTVPGWASTTLPIYFIGGIQILCLGVIGEYVGQVYTVVKKRPRWISEHKLD